MNGDIQALAAAYRQAVGGNSDLALEMAIAELLDARAEADFRAQALDQWVSRGYVQGQASELCRRQVSQRLAGKERRGETDRKTLTQTSPET